MNMVHFFKNLETLSAASKSALKDFAACPTESNQAYFIGYLAALLSNKLISTDSYNYFVALAGRIALDKHSADRVYWELRGDATLAEKVTETGKQTLRALLEKVKVALESCDVNDTQFPLDTQYYDRELVDAALADVDAMLKDCHE